MKDNKINSDILKVKFQNVHPLFGATDLSFIFNGDIKWPFDNNVVKMTLTTNDLAILYKKLSSEDRSELIKKLIQLEIPVPDPLTGELPSFTDEQHIILSETRAYEDASFQSFKNLKDIHQAFDE